MTNIFQRTGIITGLVVSIASFILIPRDIGFFLYALRGFHAGIVQECSGFLCYEPSIGGWIFWFLLVLVTGYVTSYLVFRMFIKKKKFLKLFLALTVILTFVLLAGFVYVIQWDGINQFRLPRQIRCLGISETAEGGSEILGLGPESCVSIHDEPSG